jgi:hypothetical protein
MVFDYYFKKIKTEKIYGYIIYVLDFIYFLLFFSYIYILNKHNIHVNINSKYLYSNKKN